MKKHRYLPSIDSLRALAVISVIIYHMMPNHLPGGFLGVDLFFVLSGYLISSLIMQEYSETGKISLSKFYIRRARRLLPAVYLMISIILIIMVLFNKYILEKSYLDAIFGYIYSSNWWYMFHKLDYFDSFYSISPYKHLWSLAIEEQFYMIFPLIFIILQKISSKFKNKNIFFYSIIFMSLLSLITHIILFDIDNINRVYYGTDTRAFGLLVGVLGAIYFPLSKLTEKVTLQENKNYTLISLVSILIFIISMFYVSEYSKFLYYGGFFLFSCLFLIILISTGHQNTYISKIMSFKPLVYIGRFSYSLYLWHFPIIILTRPASESGNPNLFFNLARLVLIFLVSWISYKFLETPIRYFGFANYLKNIFKKISNLSKNIKISALLTSSLIIILLVMGLFGKAFPYISTKFANDNSVELSSSFVTNNAENNNYNKDNNKKEDKSNDANSEETFYNKILLIGDSLAVNIGEEMTTRYPEIVIDGRISRQGAEAVEVAKKYENYNDKNAAVIFILGTNGTITEKHIESLIKTFEKSDVYFVNINVPRAWEEGNNKLLEESKTKYENFNLIDWNKKSKNHPEYFRPDNVHLREEGVTAMADLISKNLKYQVKTTPTQ
ncbi:acyltransferase family protein [Gemella sp. zg-1178]|uniref:acyltransferase family protein n=1 Tax=Gemella sp. zg-1178 TaxID=2840372 RepID=UPI001C043468|nr:acyltransferase family protein [Gemella sp. zg-1178]MBU0278323.1 acyltransferase [Gemella sp. zg-1178]